MSISRELISKREVCGFTLSFQETKGPLPWPPRSVFPGTLLGYPPPRLCKAGPAPVQTREVEVREIPAFVPAPVPTLSYLREREG